VYGEGAVKVVNEIGRQRNRFKEVPVGPIGLHIKVKDGKQEWAGSIENAIGSSLSGFIVTNHDDRRVLQDIIRRFGCNFSVYTLSHQRRHSLRQPQCSNPHNGVPFAMLADCIAVDNDLVWNCLVDWARMDGAAFTRTMEEAEHLAGSGRRFPAPINNVYDCSGWLTEYRNGSSIQRSVEWGGDGRGGQRKRLGVDSSAMRVNMQREVVAAREELERMRKEAGACERKVAGLEKRFRELKAELRRGEGEVEKVVDGIREVQEAISDASDVKESLVDFDGLQREIDAYADQVKELQTKQAEEKEELARLEEELRPLQEREANEMKIMKALEKQIAQVQGKIEDGLAAIDEKERVRKRYEVGLMRAEQAGREVQKALGEATAAAEQAMESVRDYTRNALKEDWDGEDVVPSSTRDALVKKLKEKERGLVIARAQHATKDTVAVVRQKAQNALEAYVGKKKQIEAQKRNMLRLEEGMAKRRKKLKGFRKYIVRRADQAFDRVLQHKGQSGTLTFNQRTRELGIEVQKDARDESTTSKNVKELSGGERSYTTLALLIALGEAIECPFRVMDEFDIFMDAVARKTALDLLVQTATGEDMQHRQFIFITPQDLSHVQGKISDTFKIHKLVPPIRTEGTLQQTTL
jgi:chromosome segregation ATPase